MSWLSSAPLLQLALSFSSGAPLSNRQAWRFLTTTLLHIWHTSHSWFSSSQMAIGHGHASLLRATYNAINGSWHSSRAQLHFRGLYDFFLVQCRYFSPALYTPSRVHCYSRSPRPNTRSYALLTSPLCSGSAQSFQWTSQSYFLVNGYNICYTANVRADFIINK